MRDIQERWVSYYLLKFQRIWINYFLPVYIMLSSKISHSPYRKHHHIFMDCTLCRNHIECTCNGPDVSKSAIQLYIYAWPFDVWSIYCTWKCRIRVAKNAVCKIIAGIEICFLVLKKCVTSSKLLLYLQFICKMGMNNNFISYYKNYIRLKLCTKLSE